MRSNFAIKSFLALYSIIVLCQPSRAEKHISNCPLLQGHTDDIRNFEFDYYLEIKSARYLCSKEGNMKIGGLLTLEGYYGDRVSEAYKCGPFHFVDYTFVPYNSKPKKEYYGDKPEEYYYGVNPRTNNWKWGELTNKNGDEYKLRLIKADSSANCSAKTETDTTYYKFIDSQETEMVKAISIAKYVG
jgi:hypothetical protein